MSAQPHPAQRVSTRPSRGRTVLDDRDISRALTRISHEILERNKGADDLVLLGIPSRGVPLADRIAERIAAVEGVDVPVGSLDVTMYRDDLRLKPARTLLPTADPATAASTTRSSSWSTTCCSPAARSAPRSTPSTTSAGRAAVQLAVLVDRGHRELPIRADFVGKNLPTSLVERVRVSLAGVDRRRDAVHRSREPAHEDAPAVRRRPDAATTPSWSSPPPRRCARWPTGRSRSCPALRGRTVVNLFFEDSTRTRISFEAAAKRLSADVINFSAKGS